MRRGFGLLVGVLAVCLFPAGAKAVSFTFESTTPDTSVDVRFTADLSIAGDTLTLVLTNDSLNHVNGASSSLNPNDLLTSFYFDVFDGISSRPTLTYTGASGNVCLTSSGGADNCGIVDKEADLRALAAFDNTWQFKDTFGIAAGTVGTLTFGVGTAGNNSLSPNNFNGNFVDGFDYGLYAGDVTTPNLNNTLLTTGSITFTWSGATGFTDADIVEAALFGLGTKPDSFGLIPEPAMGLLLGLGVLGLAWHGRRR
jgi:hypothetical protein